MMDTENQVDEIFCGNTSDALHFMVYTGVCVDMNKLYLKV